MLIKVSSILLGETRDSVTNWQPSEYGRKELYINPDRILWLEMPTGKMTHALLQLDNRQITLTLEDGQRLIDHINQTTPPAAAAPAPAPMVMRTNLLSMTRDETQKSRSPMWRCGTEAGFMVNVFKHDDPLKDTFKLFDAAKYAPEMLAMNTGDTITWTRDSIYVEIKQNDSFWNVVRVFERPPGAMPDEPEPDDDSGDSDNDPIIL